MSIMDSINRMRQLKKDRKCPRCEKSIKDEKYKDATCLAESKITGYCQKCMDYVFDEMLAFQEEQDK